MRSHLRTTRLAMPLLIAGCAALGTSGCQVGRTFFQMDSNAPVPFFGMDLLPKRNQQSPTAGVSRFQDAEPAEVRQAALSETAAPTKSSKGWGSLLGRSAKPQTMNLPARNEDEEQAPREIPVEQFR